MATGLGPGLGGSVNPFDPNYQHQLLVASNQQQADAVNAKAVALYTARATQLKEDNIQQAADHLPLLTLDPPPHKKVLSVDGMSVVDSTELVCPPISVIPDPVTTAGAGTPTIAATTQAGVDPVTQGKLDQIIAMLMAIGTKLGLGGPTA